ncbi:MAG: hypothetical protein JWQ38_176 [Flavipsychrobacter sp.]|nr:hypothetical protein [Flavipsychrobacter sp.]
MNELVELMKTKAGLTDEQAVKAVEAMKEYLQGKVPPMFSGFVDQFFAGKSSDNDKSLF